MVEEMKKYINNYKLDDLNRGEIYVDDTFRSTHTTNISFIESKSNIGKKLNTYKHQYFYLKNIDVIGDVNISMYDCKTNKLIHGYLSDTVIINDSSSQETSSIVFNPIRTDKKISGKEYHREGFFGNAVYDANLAPNFISNSFIIMDSQALEIPFTLKYVFGFSSSMGTSKEVTKLYKDKRKTVTLAFSDGRIKHFHLRNDGFGALTGFQRWAQELYEDVELNLSYLNNLPVSEQLYILKKLRISLGLLTPNYIPDIEESERTKVLTMEEKVSRSNPNSENLKQSMDAPDSLDLKNTELAQDRSIVNSEVKSLKGKLEVDILRNVNDNSHSLIIKGLEEFKSYNTDLVKMMSLPILSQLSDPKVKRFNLLCIRIENNIDLTMSPEEFFNEWLELKNYAEKTKLSGYSDLERKTIKDAKVMLDKALNDESTDTEKQSSIKGMFNILEGTLPINENVISWTKHKVGLKELI